MIGFICRFINKVLADRVVYKRMYLEKLHKIDQENHRAHTELVEAYRQSDRVRVHDIMSRHMAECACHVADLEATVATRFLSDLSVNWLPDAMP